jgi:plasmid stabilization system protein ParE
VLVTFSELAEREMNEAAQYYESEQPGLGVAFLADVMHGTEAIVEHPAAGVVVLGSIRRRLCRRFPYARLYDVTPHEVRVLAVMHLKRRPGYWVGRA